MGFEFYIALKPDVGIESDDCSLLFRFRGRGIGMEPDFAAIERELNLPPLTDFLSCSMEHQARWNRHFPGAYPQEQPERWFEPNQALSTISGLMDYFRSHPKIGGAENFIEELERSRKVLENAQQKNVLFHFVGVPP